MTSRLKIGRLPVGKPPKIIPCVHPRRTGIDVLPNGGFETGYNQGPLGNEIPGWANVGGLIWPFFNWSGGTQAPYPSGLWWQDGNTDAGKWTYSSVAPHSGTRHIRQTRTSVGGQALRPTGFFCCTSQSAGWTAASGFSWWNAGASAVVLPGDTWTLQIFSKAASIADPLRWFLTADYSNFDDTDYLSGTSFVLGAMTTSYAALSYTEVVPSAATLGFEPHLLFLGLQSAWTAGTGNTAIDLDTVTLAVN